MFTSRLLMAKILNQNIQNPTAEKLIISALVSIFHQFAQARRFFFSFLNIALLQEPITITPAYYKYLIIL